LVAAAKFLVAATKKNISLVPNFVAATKPFFSVKHQNQNRFQFFFSIFISFEREGSDSSIKNFVKG